MLQEMRKFTQSWVSTIFMGILALSFGVWGIADIFTGTTDTSVATIGKTVISSAAYQQEYNNTLKRQTGPDGRQMQSDAARKAGIPAQVLNGMIDRTALDNIARSMGLTTSDATVASEIRAVRGFAGPLGSFDHNTFLRVVGEQGYTEQGFIELVRDDLTRTQLLSAARTGFALPAGYISTLFSYLNEVRAAEYVVLPPNAGGAVAAPTDAQLAAFVKSHAATFSTPAYREIDYAVIGPDDLASETQPTEAQLKQQYELLKSDPNSGYDVAEKRDVEQIDFKTEADAKAAKAKLDGGMTFDALAKSLGKTEASLGTVTKEDLGARGAAVFALADNGVTDPQKNLAGWALLQVTKITPAVHKTFEDVKADILKTATAELVQAKLGDISNAYTDANSGGLSLIEAGKKVGMKTGHIAAVDIHGLAPDGSKTAVAGDPDFLKQVFAADVGDEGDPFAVKSGKLYVLKVNGVTPPKLKPLDQVRVEAAAQWTAQQRQEKLVAKAKELVAEADKDHNLNAAAAVAGTPVLKTGRLYRPQGTPQPDTSLPLPIVGAIFEAEPGTAVTGPGPNGTYIVARVTGVLHRDLPVSSLQFQQGSQQLSEQSAQDFNTLLAQAARRQQTVKINQQNADRVTGEGS